jgi:hypothetical protein
VALYLRQAIGPISVPGIEITGDAGAVEEVLQYLRSPEFPIGKGGIGLYEFL